jgi:XTP/dITP diphosphohydrolase
VTRPLFVTSNPGKLREIEEFLGERVEQIDLDLPEIQALDVADVVRQKALSAFAAVGRPIVVEDTGLSIDALGGLPGALIKWFLIAIGPAGICRLIPPDAGRAATARSAIGYCAGETVEIFTGETRGEIVLEPAGDDFGWNPIFRPDGSPRTFAEMNVEERNRFSMRRLALEQLRKKL